jgi:hypothetical protein
VVDGVPGPGDRDPLGSVPVVAAAGEWSVGESPNRATYVLAELLGSTAVAFTGDDGGYGCDPTGFGDALTKLFLAS